MLSFVGGFGLTLGLDDLRDLSQPKQFCDSVTASSAHRAHPVPTLHAHLLRHQGHQCTSLYCTAVLRQVILAGMGSGGVGRGCRVWGPHPRCAVVQVWGPHPRCAVVHVQCPGHTRSPSGRQGLTSATALPLPLLLAGHATQKYCREFLIEVLLGEIKQEDVKGSTSPLACTVWGADYRLPFPR